MGSWRDPSLPTLKAGPENELRADGPPCDAEGDDIRLLVRLDLIAFCPYVEEQLLQIKFDWPIQLANGYRDPHLLPTAMIRYMVVVLARPIFCGVLARPILADIESGTRENEVITPWSQTPNLIQLVQGSPTTV